MINVTGGINYFTVSFTPSKEVDVVGYLIHASTDPDFVPSRLLPEDGGNLINNGPETSFYYKCAPGNYYIKIAPYDTFEDLDNIDTVHLNYTSAIPVTVSSPDAIVLPDEIYNELRTDFILNDVQFYFGAIPYAATLKATLYWNGGTTGEIIRGTTHYALTGTGSIANANGKYVVATLNDGSNTASLSVIPIASGITLAGNEVVIAITSDNPLVSNSNNICYVRQSNSMQYEGALIRYATITDAHITGVLSASKIVANWSSIIDDNGNMPAANADSTQTVIDGGLVTTGRLEVGNGAFGSANAGVNGSGSSGTDIRFWAGSTYSGRATAPFRVDQSGALYATDAYISGSILGSTLTGSTITGGTITGSTIQTASGSVRRFVVSDTNNQAEFYGNRGDGTIEKLAVIGIDSYLGLGIDYVASIGSINGTVGAIAATSDSAKTIRSNSTSGIALLTESTTGYGAWLGQDVLGTYRQGLDGFVGASPCRLAPGNGAGAPTHNAEIGSLWVDKNGILYIQTTWRNGNGWQKVGAQ